MGADQPPGVTYVAVEGCACPVPDGAEWTLRYGTTEAREAQRYGVASIVNAFAHLLDPNVSQRDALSALKRLRRAQVIHSTGTELCPSCGFDGRQANVWQGGILVKSCPDRHSTAHRAVHS